MLLGNDKYGVHTFYGSSNNEYQGTSPVLLQLDQHYQSYTERRELTDLVIQSGALLTKYKDLVLEIMPSARLGYKVYGRELYGQAQEASTERLMAESDISIQVGTLLDRYSDILLSLAQNVHTESDLHINISRDSQSSVDIHLAIGKIAESQKDLHIRLWIGPLLGDQDLSELGLTLTDETIIGFSPSVKIEEVTIPGKHGAFLQGNKLGDRVFELELTLDPNRDLDLDYTERVAAFLSARARVASLLNSIRDNSTLVFAEEPERVYKIFWKDISGIQEYIDSGVITIPLVARPEAVSVDEHIIQVPAGIPFTLRYEGTRAINPIITLNSQQEESLDFNNRETIIRAINRTDLTGYLNTVIDGDNFEVTSQYDQGQVPDLDRLQGTFPELVPGDNIILSTTALTITYKDIWDD